MKTVNLGRMGFYAGSGVGLILFVLAGLLPSAYFAGALGSNIFGNHQVVFVAPVMIVGVLVAGIVFSVGIAFIGWLGGTVADTLKASSTVRIAHQNELVAEGATGHRGLKPDKALG